jgi:hypothetical protein
VFSEDYLVDLALLADDTTLDLTAAIFSKSPFEKARDLIAANAGYIVIGLIVALGSGGLPNVATLLLFVLFWFLGAAFWYWLRGLALLNIALAWLLGAVAVLAGGTGLGFALYYGGPWLLKGVREWWSWLGSHF